MKQCGSIFFPCNLTRNFVRLRRPGENASNQVHQISSGKNKIFKKKLVRQNLFASPAKRKAFPFFTYWQFYQNFKFQVIDLFTSEAITMFLFYTPKHQSAASGQERFFKNLTVVIFFIFSPSVS